MDATLQVIILLGGLSGVVYSIHRTGDWINPVSMLFIFFFLPVFFALFRMSGLQSNQWHYNTYIAIFTSIGAWMLFPIVLIAARANAVVPLGGRSLSDVLRSPSYIWLTRGFGVVIVASYITSNYIQAGDMLAFRNAEAAFQIHTVFPFGLRYFARAGVAGVVLLYGAYWAARRKTDLALMLMVLVVPLTRLSRIDVAMGLVALMVLFAAIPLFKWSFKRVALILSVFSLLVIAGVELGSLRQNRFDKYSFKYSDFILWKPEWLGPVEIFPTLYGYFSLPFENLDTYVRQFRGGYGIALTSFDWLFTGFLKFNWFTSYAFAQAEHFQFTPVSSAANVPSALTPFYSDLGPIGMALPMLLYVSFWLYLYYRSKSSMRSLLVYAIYSGAFALVSFQAIISAAFLFHQLLEVVVIFSVAAWLEGYRRQRQAVKDGRRAMAAGLMLK